MSSAEAVRTTGGVDEVPVVRGESATDGPELRRRREQLGLTTARFAELAMISPRAVQKAEAGSAGRTVMTRITTTLARLEGGETPTLPAQRHILRIEVRHGVFITIDAEDAARLGDLREVEEAVRRLIVSRGNNAG